MIEKCLLLKEECLSRLQILKKERAAINSKKLLINLKVRTRENDEFSRREGRVIYEIYKLEDILEVLNYILDDKSNDFFINGEED